MTTGWIELPVVGGSSGGTVTSVALTAPAILTVSGSPITTSGTLALTLATQAANLVWSGPTTGAAAAPTFRALVAADIPNLSAAKITSGQGTLSTSTTGVTVGSGSNSLLSSATINIQNATTSQNGLLTKEDWTTFSNKQSGLTFGNLTTSTSGVSITGGTGAVIGSGTHAINIQTADGFGDTGLLTSADWVTFNSKADVGNYITALTGDVTASGPGSSSATLATTLTGPRTLIIGPDDNAFNLQDDASPNSRINAVTRGAGNENSRFEFYKSGGATEIGEVGVNTSANSGSGQDVCYLGVISGGSNDSGVYCHATLGVAIGGTNTSFPGTSPLIVDRGGNKVYTPSGISLGVGVASPTALFSVGASSALQVDSSGNLSTSGTIVGSNLTSAAAEASIPGSLTWAGVAPTGVTTSYRFTQAGKMVTLFVSIATTVAGTANTQVSFPLPAGMPTPHTWSNNASSVYQGAGQLSTAAVPTIAAGGQAFLSLIAATWTVTIADTAAVAAADGWCTISYLVD